MENVGAMKTKVPSTKRRLNNRLLWPLRALILLQALQAHNHPGNVDVCLSCSQLTVALQALALRRTSNT